MPIAVALRSRRDGLWTAILGVVALLTIKFPGNGLFPFLSRDGGNPWTEQYALILLTVVLAAALASFLARKVGPVVGILPVILWLGFVVYHMPAVFFDLSLYARVALAMTVAVLLLWVERAIGRTYGATA